MTVYYNERDPFAAAWLRELIKDGLIAPGDVDERDIQRVTADDLRPYTQCHFFAGIGGWSYALRLAGWPDDWPVWTGSCPCQPLSSAGQRKGHADERHIWPAFHALIAERRPAVVFGEQVAGTLGYEWLAGVRADLEGDRYAVGAANLCAASAGAPHIRQRLFWVANAMRGRQTKDGIERDQSVSSRPSSGPPDNIAIDGLADANGRLSGHGHLQSGGEHGQQPQDGGAGGLVSTSTSQNIAWSRTEWLRCLDGKTRRVESGIFPLAHGVPNRLGTLRGAGNAIVPQVAAQFIGAFVDAAI